MIVQSPARHTLGRIELLQNIKSYTCTMSADVACPDRVHEDLKPDNILLSMVGSGSPYDFTPIIADFGHSHIKPMQPGDMDRTVPDRCGNQEFGKSQHSRPICRQNATQHDGPS
jgi:serine/threonine protein kinase